MGKLVLLTYLLFKTWKIYKSLWSWYLSILHGCPYSFSWLRLIRLLYFCATHSRSVYQANYKYEYSMFDPIQCWPVAFDCSQTSTNTRAIHARMERRVWIKSTASVARVFLDTQDHCAKQVNLIFHLFKSLDQSWVILLELHHIKWCKLANGVTVAGFVVIYCNGRNMGPTTALCGISAFTTPTN